MHVGDDCRRRQVVHCCSEFELTGTTKPTFLQVDSTSQLQGNVSSSWFCLALVHSRAPPSPPGVLVQTVPLDMPAPHVVPSAAVIAREVDRLTIARQQKKLPSTFLHSFSVKERLRDLAIDALPDAESAIDRTCTKALSDTELAAVKLANDALLLFSRLAYLVDHDNPALRSMMLHSWDAGVWKWMLFLYNAGVDLNISIANEGGPLPLTRQSITVGIMDALVGCADSVPLGKRLIRVPDIVALIAKLWAEDLEIPGRPNVVHKELTFTMYHIMNDALDDSIFSTLVDAVDGGAETIMRAATAHFRRLVSSAPIISKDIDSQIFFIEFLAKNPMLRDAMHKDTVDTLSIALSAIDALAKQSAQVRGYETVQSCIDVFFLQHLLSGTNVKPLIHSINNGLLRTLYDARVAFRLNEDCCEALAEVIIRVVGKYFSRICLTVFTIVSRPKSYFSFRPSRRRAVGDEDRLFCELPLRWG